MRCTFFGHRNAPDNIKTILKSAIIQLIEFEGVKSFYIGNNGNFDFLAQCALIEIAAERNDINCTVVLSHIGEKALCGRVEYTIFPEALEGVIPKFAISKRNEWLLKKCNFVITYKKHNYSNTQRLIEKAVKKGLKIIALQEQRGYRPPDIPL